MAQTFALLSTYTKYLVAILRASGVSNTIEGGYNKKGTDTDTDGIINFFDDNTGKAQKIVVQVRSGC